MKSQLIKTIITESRKNSESAKELHMLVKLAIKDTLKFKTQLQLNDDLLTVFFKENQTNKDITLKTIEYKFE